MSFEGPIAPSATIGTAQLRVSELERAIRFYSEVVGLERLDGGDATAGGSTASLGVDAPVLRLREVPGATRPGRAAGLYHAAILMPTRAHLGEAIKRVLGAGWPTQGASDHGFSEALYLSDPDGNGLEIYADRPREEWPEPSDLEAIRPAPMDVEAVISESGGTSTAPTSRMPAKTTLGHVHLHVGDLEEARRFYCDGIGFGMRQQVPGQAAFVSAGDYHHHVAYNTWAGRGVGPAPEGSTGIDEFEVVVPEESEVGRVESRLRAAGHPAASGNGTLRAVDPAGVEVVVRPAG